MSKIGILGGTFNPVHNGHLHIAEQSANEFNLDRVIFVPSGLPPHKSTEDLAPKEDRLRMVELAVEGNPKFSVSRTEIDRSGFSYAVDTFNELRREFGEEAELYYIMGMDSINDILSWRKPLELFRLCKFIVATRPGSRVRTFNRLMKFPPIKENIKKINLIEVSLNISSTDIRRNLKADQVLDKFIPKKVIEYIKDKKLYK